MEKGFGLGVAIVVVTLAVFVVLGVEVALLPSGSFVPLPTSLPVPVGTVFSLARAYGSFGPYQHEFPFIVNSTKLYRITGGWNATSPTDVDLWPNCRYCPLDTPPPPDAPTSGTFGMTIDINFSSPASNLTVFLRFRSLSPDTLTITQAFVLAEVPAGTYSCPPGYWAC